MNEKSQKTILLVEDDFSNPWLQRRALKLWDMP